MFLHVLRRKSQIEEFSLCSLPSQFRDPTSTDLENRAAFLAALVAQIRDQRHDELRLQGVQDGLWQDGLSHSGGSNRANGVDPDVVFLALSGQSLSEAVQGEFGGGIVDLTESAV